MESLRIGRRAKRRECRCFRRYGMAAVFGSLIRWPGDLIVVLDDPENAKFIRLKGVGALGPDNLQDSE